MSAVRGKTFLKNIRLKEATVQHYEAIADRTLIPASMLMRAEIAKDYNARMVQGDNLPLPDGLFASNGGYTEMVQLILPLGMQEYYRVMSEVEGVDLSVLLRAIIDSGIREGDRETQ